jgi:RHS repeat-associated protein
LANGANIAQASAWRGHWSDITGYNQIGLRPYDPVSGRWLTFDSVWNERDPNYFSFSGGDPINAFDHDGRMSKIDYQTLNGVCRTIRG